MWAKGMEHGAWRDEATTIDRPARRVCYAEDYRSLPLLRERQPRLALLPRTRGGKPCFYRSLSGRLCFLTPQASSLTPPSCRLR